MKIAILCLANLFALCISAQNIALTQTRSNTDVSILSGKYVLYVRGDDVADAISKIDSVTRSDNMWLAKEIKAGKIKSVNLSSASSADKAFIELIKTNLGVYLLLKGKISIHNGAGFLKQIVAEEGPPEVELDEVTSHSPFSFSEDEVQRPFFVGYLSGKLMNRH